MSDIRPGDDPAAKMERDADELDHRIHRLEDHISDAKKGADARRQEASPGEKVAGDWEDEGEGEGPEGGG